MYGPVCVWVCELWRQFSSRRKETDVQTDDALEDLQEFQWLVHRLGVTASVKLVGLFTRIIGSCLSGPMC